MSESTKRKHVTQEVLNADIRLPEPSERIVKVLGGRGNNLHEVLDPKENGPTSTYLVSMPNKFRKNVWIKRGDFVLVSPIEEGDKVKAEIVQILVDKHHIRYIKEKGLWPFVEDEKTQIPVSEALQEDRASDDSAESDGDNDDDLFVNTNRPTVEYSESEDSSEDES